VIQLLSSSSLILALTTEEDCLQCSAMEALSLGIPIVCSNTKYLKSVFSKGTVFVENYASSISQGILDGLTHIERLKEEIMDLQGEYKKRWELLWKHLEDLTQ